MNQELLIERRNDDNESHKLFLSDILFFIEGHLCLNDLMFYFFFNYDQAFLYRLDVSKEIKITNIQRRV